MKIKKLLLAALIFSAISLSSCAHNEMDGVNGVGTGPDPKSPLGIDDPKKATPADSTWVNAVE